MGRRWWWWWWWRRRRRPKSGLKGPKDQTWREINRNVAVVVVVVEVEGKQYKCGGGGGGEKIIKIVEEGIKTLRRENIKIGEKGLKKI